MNATACLAQDLSADPDLRGSQDRRRGRDLDPPAGLPAAACRARAWPLADQIRHRPIGAPSTASVAETSTPGWLPRFGPLVIGLTAGASTPNNVVGQVVARLEALAS